MNARLLSGLCAAIAALTFAPGVASARSDSNLTCNLGAQGTGAELEDVAVGHVECLSLTEMSYDVTVDVSLQYYIDGSWIDPGYCSHATASGSAHEGVAVVAAPLTCNYLGGTVLEIGPRRAHVEVTESLDSDVRTFDSDPWTIDILTPGAAR